MWPYTESVRDCKRTSMMWTLIVRPNRPACAYMCTKVRACVVIVSHTTCVFCSYDWGFAQPHPAANWHLPSASTALIKLEFNIHLSISATRHNCNAVGACTHCYRQTGPNTLHATAAIRPWRPARRSHTRPGSTPSERPLSSGALPPAGLVSASPGHSH